jgi:hypothetical protein
MKPKSKIPREIVSLKASKASEFYFNRQACVNQPVK